MKKPSNFFSGEKLYLQNVYIRFSSKNTYSETAAGGRGPQRRNKFIYEFIRTLSLFCTGDCLQTGAAWTGQTQVLGNPILSCRSALEQQEPPNHPGKRCLGPGCDSGYQGLWGASQKIIFRWCCTKISQKYPVPTARALGCGNWGRVWDARQLQGCAQPGREQKSQPSLEGTRCDPGWHVPWRGWEQQLPRGRAGAGRGKEQYQSHRSVPRSPRSASPPWAQACGLGTAFSLGAPGCCRAPEQVSPASAAWRCHQMGNKKVVSGINMHK